MFRISRSVLRVQNYGPTEEQEGEVGVGIASLHGHNDVVKICNETQYSVSCHGATFCHDALP